MDLLEKNGTAIVVLKEGVFFTSKYKDLRKCLIKNFNVTKIISVPSDEFENTTTKTSIIVFKNTEEKTSKINFYDLIINKHQNDVFEVINDEVVLLHSKNDIIDITDNLVSIATKDDLLNNNIFSFNAKDYIKQTIIPGDNYKLVKLGDICDFLPKSKRKASFGKDIGNFNFYTSSNKIKRCDIADYREDKILIIGDGGKANIHIDNIFSCSDHHHLLKINNNLIDFIYYLFKSNLSFLENGFRGSTLKNLSKKYLSKLYLPIPKDNKLIVEWSNKISKPYVNKIDLELKLKNLEQDIQDNIQSSCDNEEYDEVGLGDVCEIETGKKKKQYLKQLIGDSNYTHNKSNRKGINIIISRVGKNNFKLVNEEFYLTDNGYTLNINDIKLKKYICYYFNNNTFKIGNGSAQKVISKTKIKKIKLKIPKDKQLIKNLEPKFELIEQYQKDIKKSEILFNKYIEELKNEAIKEM